MISIALIAAVVFFALSPWTLLFLIVTATVDIVFFTIWLGLKDRQREESTRTIWLNFMFAPKRPHKELGSTGKN